MTIRKIARISWYDDAAVVVRCVMWFRFRVCCCCEYLILFRSAETVRRTSTLTTRVEEARDHRRLIDTPFSSIGVDNQSLTVRVDRPFFHRWIRLWACRTNICLIILFKQSLHSVSIWSCTLTETSRSTPNTLYAVRKKLGSEGTWPKVVRCLILCGTHWDGMQYNIHILLRSSKSIPNIHYTFSASHWIKLPIQCLLFLRHGELYYLRKSMSSTFT